MKCSTSNRRRRRAFWCFLRAEADPVVGGDEFILVQSDDDETNLLLTQSDSDGSSAVLVQSD